jgi:bla regulator protein blaR1
MSAVSPVAAVVDHLAWASIAIALMVAAAWLACRLRPSLAPSTRSTIWWLVAVAALLRLAPLPALTLEVPATWRLGGLLPAAAPPAPVRTAPASALDADAADSAVGELPRAPSGVAARIPTRAAEQLRTPFVPVPASRSAAAAAADTAFDWRTPLVALWAVVACALFARLAIANWRLRRLADDAGPVPDAVAAEVDALAAALGLRRTPAVRISGDIETPQVFGLFRPTVLLPDAALTALTPRERAMTLCHELAHVRRLDLAFAWAPAVMERLLFFHPGARLAAREYAFAREAACDADVLQHLGEAPRDYGRLLLRLGVTRRPAALAAAQSSPSTRLLRRRLALLNHHVSPRPGRGLWLAGALLPLALPLSLVAGQSDQPPAPPTPPAPARAAAPPAPPVPAITSAVLMPPAPPAPASLRAPSAVGHPSVIAGDEQQPPPPPPPPAAPSRGTVPPPPPPPPPAATNGQGFYWVGDHDGTIVLFDGNGTSVFSGSHHDAEDARRLRGGDTGPFLYYRHNGQAYTSRDRALIDRVRGEMREQRELGEKQGELGRLQGELGAQQGALGAKQAAMSADFAAAGQAMAVAGHDARLRALERALVTLESERGEKTAELEAAGKAIREAIESLRQVSATTAADAQQQASALRAEAETKAAQQRDVAAEQRALGERQAELGRRQAELGRQQKAAADAAHQRIMRLLQEAVTTGQAQPVK